MKNASLEKRLLKAVGAVFATLSLSACPPTQHGVPCESDADCGLEHLCQSGYCLRPELQADPALDEPVPETDAGPVVEDAGQQQSDAGSPPDAGQADAGRADAGADDGGQGSDAGQADAGQADDAGVADGGEVDGGVDDGGQTFDAGPGCADVPPVTRPVSALQPTLDGISLEDFGQEMDANEGRLVVSDPETAQVFIYDENAGVYDAPPTVVSGDATDRFGWAVTTAADVVVVTAPTADPVSEGGVLVHRRTTGGDGWELSEELVCAGADSNTYMGARAVMREVSTDKYVLLVGAFSYPQAPNDDAGAVCVWTYDAVTESFTARAPVLRDDPNVPGNFGAPIATSDDAAYLAVRASTTIVDDFATGEVFLYSWDNGTNTYTHVQTLTPDAYTLPPDGAYDDSYESWFGQGLDFAGDTLFVGASGWLPSGQSNHGAVFEYTLDTGTWSNTDIIASPGSTFFGFGGSLAADDGTLVVGTGPWFSYDTDRAAFVYRRGCDGWFFEESLAKDDLVSGFDRFSDRVHITTDNILVGNHNAANATGVRVGAVRVYPRTVD